MHRNIRLLCSFARKVFEYKYYVFGSIGTTLYIYSYILLLLFTLGGYTDRKLKGIYTCIIYIYFARRTYSSGFNLKVGKYLSAPLFSFRNKIIHTIIL